MPTRTIPLTELVTLFRQMTDRTWQNGRLGGELRVLDQATADFLRELLDEGQANHYPCEIVEGDPDNVKVGDLCCNQAAFEAAMGCADRSFTVTDALR